VNFAGHVGSMTGPSSWSSTIQIVTVLLVVRARMVVFSMLLVALGLTYWPEGVSAEITRCTSTTGPPQVHETTTTLSDDHKVVEQDLVVTVIDERTIEVSVDDTD